MKSNIKNMSARFMLILLFGLLFSFIETSHAQVTLIKIGFPTVKHENGKTDKNRRTQIPSRQEDYLSVLEAAFKKKSQIHCFPNYREIESLANEMGLMTPPEYNPDLIFDVGDISYWALEGIKIDPLIRQFAALKAAREALENEKTTLLKRRDSDNLKGMWMAVSRKIITETNINEDWSNLRKKYSECQSYNFMQPKKDCEGIISFLVDDEMMIVNSCRIKEMQAKISSSPYQGRVQAEEVQKLAEDYYDIDNELKCNDYLQFYQGDYQNKVEEYDGDAKKLNNFFAAIKVVLDAAKYDNHPCFELHDNGKLSYIAEEFIVRRYLSE